MRVDGDSKIVISDFYSGCNLDCTFDFDPDFDIDQSAFSVTGGEILSISLEVDSVDMLIKPIDEIVNIIIDTNLEDGDFSGVSVSVTEVTVESNLDPVMRIDGGVDQIIKFAPVPVFFEGYQSAPREEIVKYEWDFGDGAKAEGFNAAHVYQAPGTYTATLTISDAAGNFETVENTVIATKRSTVYYVKNAGNDNADGLSYETAWRTADHAFRKRYNLGDEVLFTPGETFKLENPVDLSSFSNIYGVLFGANNSSKPATINVQFDSGYVFPNARGMSDITFSNLIFNMNGSTLMQATRGQSILFLDCILNEPYQGFLMQGDVKGFFIIRCGINHSTGIQLYSTGSRIAILDSKFNFSENHIAYLEVVNVGVIVNNTFAYPTFGRHAFRLCGREKPTTNNVWIVGNKITGWKSPGQTRFNWMLVHIAPNVPGKNQIIKNIHFKYNTIRNGETLLNIGNVEDSEFRENLLVTEDTYTGGRRIIIGSKHHFDTRPCKNCLFTKNIAVVTKVDEGVTSLFSIQNYPGHSGLEFSENTLLCYGGLTRFMWFETPDMLNGVNSHHNHIGAMGQDAQRIDLDVDSELFQIGGRFVGGLRYTLAEWQDSCSLEEGTTVE